VVWGLIKSFNRMSDAGDDIPVDSEAPAAVEVAAEAPKGKLSVEDALQVGFVNVQIEFIIDFFILIP
jgi:hypothetical protein